MVDEFNLPEARSGLTSCLVKQPLCTRLFNAATALVVLGAWLFASNHCAIADLMPKPLQAEASHCHASPESPPQEEKERECDGSKCCKSLSAPSLGFAKNIASYDASLFVAISFAAYEQPSLGSGHDAAIAEIDTGPPRSASFAETVLQRSILAHAPPSRA